MVDFKSTQQRHLSNINWGRELGKKRLKTKKRIKEPTIKVCGEDNRPQKSMYDEVLAADSTLYLTGGTRYNPDALSLRKGGLRIYDKMRRDDTISSCLGLKKYAVLSSGWKIVPNSEDEQDKEIATFVQYNIDNMDGAFDDVMLQIMTAFDYGFSITEKVLQVGTWHGKAHRVLLKSLKTRSPHGLDFKSDVYGNLEEDGIVQNRTKQYPTDKFIIYVNKQEFGNWYGESDIRNCYRCYSEDTEVLTDDGWKLFSDVSCSDRFATLNRLDEVEYDHAVDSFVYDFDGDMFHQGGEHVDLLVTPNHRMWVKGENETEYKFILAKYMPQHVQFKVYTDYSSVVDTPCNVHDDHRSYRKYKGKVYCVTVPNGIICVRRNGKSCWCGNSWWSKDNIIKFWNIFLERYGMPPAIGTIEGDLKNESADMEALQKILTSLQSASSIVLPDNVKLSFPDVGTGQATQSYSKAVEVHDMAMARTLLIPNLLGLSAQGAHGSYGQSKTQFDVFLFIILKIRRGLEELLNEHLVKELVDYNYTVENYPKFTFEPVDRDTKVELAKLFLEAVKASAIIPDEDDENTLRKMLGWREKKVDKAQLNRAHEQSTTTTYSDTGFYRKLTKYEERVNFEKVGTDLDNLELSGATELIAILDKQRDHIIDFLYSRLTSGIANTKLINTLQLKYGRDIQRMLKELYSVSFRTGEMSIVSEVGGERSIRIPEIGVIGWLSDKSALLKGRLVSDITEKIKMTLSNGLAYKESPDDIIKKIEGIYEPWVSVVSDKVKSLEVLPYRTSLLVGMGVTEGYNQGRVYISSTSAYRDRIPAYQYSAIIDDRTTPICRHLDGKIIKKDSPDFSRIVPPNNYNCRSILVPVMKEDGPYESIGTNEMSKAIKLLPKDFGGSM